MFRRIKVSTLVKLLDENKTNESIYNLADEKEKNLMNELSNKGNSNNNITNINNDLKNMKMNENESVYSFQTNKTGQTNMTNMTSKSGITAITYATQMLGNLSDLSFLLLDLRDKEDYDGIHIKEAYSFPAMNVQRDKFPVQMINIKNKDSKLIIIYHQDERNTVPFGQLLLQKGYENIYVLSGGMEEFLTQFPEKCEGGMLEKYINLKKQNELLKKDAPLHNKTNFKINLTNEKLRSNSIEAKKQTRSSKFMEDNLTLKITAKK